MKLQHKIEAILFLKNEPVSFKKISHITQASVEEVREAVNLLKDELRDTGLSIILKDDEVELGTTKEAAPLIEDLIKDDLSKDLGRAALDTLTIVLYYGPITKTDIDNIRGVNSGFILRNLMIRGLVERVQNDRDQRSFLYKPTFDLLAHLGLSSVTDLPEYEEMRNTIDKNLKTIVKDEESNIET